ncbi:TSUP family transporter [Alicyclobacillus sp. TC]|uniref:TSUP family transporter n=1 Tax=Alicyclobacillus tolerans TaxID=90970 RepID=UPI0009328547|nr:TSUP family transporter [Alicyclobacillus montanus]QRF23038.1 TSUP family transporter [Alicyclobacillus sp. TC]
MALHLFLFHALLLLFAGFCAAFIDSSVGGGGLISLPALIVLGLPPTLALGTNKLAGTLSSITSFSNYARTGNIHFRLVRWLMPLGFVGSLLGAAAIHQISPHFLRPLVIILLIAVTLYTLFKPQAGSIHSYIDGKKFAFLGACLASLIIGAYDGFFGPGTGSFLILSFVLLGFQYVPASGNAKSVNLASNAGALAFFSYAHTVVYSWGLLLGIGMIAGALTGSQIAIRYGVKYIRPVFILMTCSMIVQQLWSILSHPHS